MSEFINNVGAFSSLPPLGRSRRTSVGGAGSPSTSPVRDTVEFSSFGRALAEAASQSTFRLARVRAVRSEIQRGDYETPEKLHATIDRLLDVIG